jgi:hypothetical protein
MKAKLKENPIRKAASLSIQSDDDWLLIEAQLPSDWRQLAEQQRLIWRNAPKHIGAKVTDIGQILRLIFYYVATNSSLKTTTATASAANLITISSVSLHQWMCKIGSYIAQLLELITPTKDVFASQRWAGYDIRVVDATAITRPGACTTTAKVHYALNLASLRPEQIEVTDEKGGETFRRFTMQPGQLWMGDRAYSNPPGVARIKRAGADVLVRYNRGTLPVYDAKGKRLDVLKKVLKLRRVGQAKQWSVWVYPQDDEPIEGRICAVRLPEDKAEEARKRVRDEYGKQITQEMLQAAAYVIVFTTVPTKKLTCKQILQLYTLRWQVELHIKRDKSIAGLDRLPNFRPDTIYSWICTKLLLVQLTEKIANSGLRSPLPTF